MLGAVPRRKFLLGQEHLVLAIVVLHLKGKHFEFTNVIGVANMGAG